MNERRTQASPTPRCCRTNGTPAKPKLSQCIWRRQPRAVRPGPPARRYPRRFKLASMYSTLAERSLARNHTIGLMPRVRHSESVRPAYPLWAPGQCPFHRASRCFPLCRYDNQTGQGGQRRSDSERNRRRERLAIDEDERTPGFHIQLRGNRQGQGEEGGFSARYRRNTPTAIPEALRPTPGRSDAAPPGDEQRDR